MSALSIKPRWLLLVVVILAPGTLWIGSGRVPDRCRAVPELPVDVADYAPVQVPSPAAHSQGESDLMFTMAVGPFADD